MDTLIYQSSVNNLLYNYTVTQKSMFCRMYAWSIMYLSNVGPTGTYRLHTHACRYMYACLRMCDFALNISGLGALHTGRDALK